MANIVQLLEALGQNAEKLSYISFDGRCDDSELFQQILEALPDEPIVMHLRNYTDLKRPIKAAEIHVDGFRDEWSRIYSLNVNLMEISPELMEWLSQYSQDGWVAIDTFVDHGPAIARLLKRPFKIIHQYGSGRQEDASYKEYGEFAPA